MILKVTDRLNCENIRVFPVLDFLYLFVSVADCNHAAIVEPCVISDVLQNFIAVNIFGSDFISLLCVLFLLEIYCSIAGLPIGVQHVADIECLKGVAVVQTVDHNILSIDIVVGVDAVNGEVGVRDA